MWSARRRNTAGVVNLSSVRDIVDRRLHSEPVGQSPVSWAHVAQGHLPPQEGAILADAPILARREPMASRTKAVAHCAEWSQKALRVLLRLEALERPLPFAHWQVRVFSAVVQALVASMLGVREHALDGRLAAAVVARRGLHLGVAGELLTVLTPSPASSRSEMNERRRSWGAEWATQRLSTQPTRAERAPWSLATTAVQGCHRAGPGSPREPCGRHAAHLSGLPCCPWRSSSIRAPGSAASGVSWTRSPASVWSTSPSKASGASRACVHGGGSWSGLSPGCCTAVAWRGTTSGCPVPTRP